MLKPSVIFAAAVTVAGCAQLPGYQPGDATAAATQRYCRDITEEGKQAIRDRVTGGAKIVRCPEDVQ